MVIPRKFTIIKLGKNSRIKKDKKCTHRKVNKRRIEIRIKKIVTMILCLSGLKIFLISFSFMV